MRLHLFLIGAWFEPLSDALSARGHVVQCVDPASAAALAPWRARMAAADAVIVDADALDLEAVSVLAQASTGGLAVLRMGSADAIASALASGKQPPVSLAGFDFVLSALGGRALARIERKWAARRAIEFYPAATATLEEPVSREWDLVYGGDVDSDSLSRVERLLVAAARAEPERCVLVAGTVAADLSRWPDNIKVEPVAPDARTGIYRNARWSLHLASRAQGICPDAGLFEAAAAGAGLICEDWPGLGTLLLAHTEFLVGTSTTDVIRALNRPAQARDAIGASGMARVGSAHLMGHRAAQLEALVREAQAANRKVRRPALA